MLRETGVPDVAEVAAVVPSDARLSRGPVAVFECFERIPCDPCATACLSGAVKPFSDINDLPQVEFDRCNGCGLCVAACPGLAVFVLHTDYAPGFSLVKMPYEFRPLPKKGALVDVMNREGSMIGAGEVVRVQVSASRTCTPVLWIKVERSLALDARHAKPRR